MRDNLCASLRRPCRTFRLRGVGIGVLLLLGFGAMGCGSSGSVSGKVYFHQKPLGGRTVTFTSPGNKTVVSQIGPDGSYTIPKIPTGEVQIAVETESAKPSEEREGMRPPKG